MKKIKLYLQEAYTELKEKVTWPTWKELRASSIVLMVASFIIALVILIMDFAFSNLMKGIYSLF